MPMREPMHLTNRDRVAVAFRILGALSGGALVLFAFATSNWNSPWMIAMFVLIVVGGALAYHLLTSLVRCPSCSHAVANFRIGQVGETRKEFVCRHCGATAWLKEGFYWQSDF